MLLSLALFALAALLAGKTAVAQRLREKFYLWLTVAVFLGIAIVILGAVLRTFPRTPKGTNVEASVTAPTVQFASQIQQ
jgi:ABC-type Mn2+/Zn2+ transport system permease subunit